MPNKDPLCPLGFHPQVRWPTRCKRCFREYKEHAPKKEEVADKVAVKTELESARARRLEASKSEDVPSTSTSKDFSSPYSSLSAAALQRLNKHREDNKQPQLQLSSEWTTFPATDTLLLPSESGTNLRRNTTDLSDFLDLSHLGGPGGNSSPPSYDNASFTVKLRKSNSFNVNEIRESSVSPVPSPPPRSKTPSPSPTYSSDDLTNYETKSIGKSSEKRSIKDGIGFQKSPLLPGSSDNLDVPKPKKPKKKRLLIQGVQEVPQISQEDMDIADGAEDNSADVAFIIQVKSTRKKKKEDDDETMSMTTTTDTTETTLVDVNESQAYSNSGVSSWEHDELKKEVERLREKCDKLEKEKGEILSRRVSNLEAPKAQSAEYIKLQQRVNQLTTTNEDLKDEQRHLESKVRELENDLATRPTSDLLQRTISELRSKVANAEAETEKLQEEKREALRKMDDMQDEFEEMQDNFREEQSEEFSTVKRELDEASKNCRLLQFKLRKVEKRADQLEAEKKEIEMRLDSLSNSGKIAQLEEELAKAKSENEKLLRESSKDKDKDKVRKLELSPKLPLKKKSPVLTKAPSGETVDPEVPDNTDSAQLLRDLQSTLERESDLREQLKFAEEEVNSMRQKISRIEDENDSLLIQIKKMSSKTKLAGANIGKNSIGKSSESLNGEKLDATELKIQLELNEQESKILRRKVEEFENTNNKLNKDLSAAEEKLQSLEHSTSVTKSKSIDEVSILRRKIIEKERDIERVQAELAALKSKGKTTRVKSVEVEEATKRHEIESRAELKRVQDEMTKVKEEATATLHNLNAELAKVKKDAEVFEIRSSQLGESNKTLLGHIEKFKRDIATMKEHYEAIQDDFVVKNSQLQTGQEDAIKDFKILRRDYDTIDKELKALRETFNNRQDTWIKEKLAMQDKMKEIEQSSKKLKNIPGDSEVPQNFKSLLKEQTNELELKRQELETYKDQIVFMQQENDKIRRQLEDFEKLSQAKMRTISNEPTAKSDREVKAIRERLQIEEKTHKNEMAQLKLRHEQEIAHQVEEVSTIQAQLSRAKRERDTFRQMVDSAQRAIAELKSRNSDTLTRRDSVSGLEEAATGARAAVLSLQERITALEDELTESRRETSRCKTEMVTEKSTWEMKLGDLQQKVNELEEDRLLGGSGRSRAVGQRTRLELAWQKEREEQQRRLKETTTLARDLKTTLLEVERERDREKIESRRRLDQTKVALEEEQEEMRRKVSESHCDLLELRDAHAKLRTANEKLRRDRERLEKDKDIQTKKELEVRQVLSERDRLLDELVTRLSPMAVSAQPTQLSAKVNLGDILQKLQSIKGIREPESGMGVKDLRRSNFRRTASAEESETVIDPSNPKIISISSSAYGKEHYGTAGTVSRATVRYTGSSSSSTLTLPMQGRSAGNGQTTKTPTTSVQDPYNSKGNLYRKSLSLEQTMSMPDEQKIWKGQSDAGSAASLKSQNSIDSRGSSIDRFSTISSKSEKPKSTSLVKKVKKLVKSKSIEESSTTAERVMRAGVQAAGVASNSGSITSLSSDTEGKKDKDTGRRLKDKVKGMFRRSSRSPSAERTKVPVQPPQPPARQSRESTPNSTMSTQRPLMPTESTVRPLKPTSR